jgi:tetratricopeptide (TPR) repeat protein
VDSTALAARHDVAVKAGAHAMTTGRFGLALELFSDALEAAGTLDNRRLVHVARLNMSACYLGLGDWARAKEGLAAIILETPLPHHASAAAVQLSEALMKEGNHGKAGHYLRLGLDSARRAEDASREMSALTMQGHLSVVTGSHAQAVDSYTAALEIAERLASPAIPTLLDQLGYAHLVAGDLAPGMWTLRRAAAKARATQNDWLLAEVHVDLAFGFLLAEKNPSAERHALQAFAMSTQLGEHPAVHKNAVFILMELSLRGNREEDFSRWFTKLQALMPDVKLSPDFFRIFDVSDVINLKEF